MSKREPKYSITLKGLISLSVSDDTAEKIWDTIELYGLRNKQNAVILKDGGVFVNVEKKK